MRNPILKVFREANCSYVSGFCLNRDLANYGKHSAHSRKLIILCILINYSKNEKEQIA